MAKAKKKPTKGVKKAATKKAAPKPQSGRGRKMSEAPREKTVREEAPAAQAPAPAEANLPYLVITYPGGAEAAYRFPIEEGDEEARLGGNVGELLRYGLTRGMGSDELGRRDQRAVAMDIIKQMERPDYGITANGRAVSPTSAVRALFVRGEYRGVSVKLLELRVTSREDGGGLERVANAYRI